MRSSRTTRQTKLKEKVSENCLKKCSPFRRFGVLKKSENIYYYYETHARTFPNDNPWMIIEALIVRGPIMRKIAPEKPVNPRIMGTIPESM